MGYLRFLREKDIFVDIKPTDKNDVIYQMVKKLRMPKKDEIFNAIIKREELKTTAIGEGVALPHIRTKNVKEIIVKFTVLDKGIDFAADDKKLVRYIILVIAPYSNTPGYLNTIARSVKTVNNEYNRKSLREAKNKKEILNIFKESSSNL